MCAVNIGNFITCNALFILILNYKRYILPNTSPREIGRKQVVISQSTHCAYYKMYLRYFVFRMILFFVIMHFEIRKVPNVI